MSRYLCWILRPKSLGTTYPGGPIVPPEIFTSKRKADARRWEFSGGHDFKSEQVWITIEPFLRP